MAANLTKLMVGALVGAGLLLSAESLAETDSGGASPGFSWKPKPAKPSANIAAPAPTPIAVPLPMRPADRTPPPSPAPAQPPPGPTAQSAPTPPAPPEPPPAPYGGTPLTGDQLAHLYQGLSSSARQALENLIKSKGVDGLSHMSEGDARSSFGGLPNNVRGEIQAKWDGLSDQQRAALKGLKSDDIKQMATEQAKEVVQASVAPIMKPVESVVKTAEAAVDQTKSFLKKSRDYVQKLIASFSGKDVSAQ